MHTEKARRPQTRTDDGRDAVPPNLARLLGFQLRMAQVALYRDFALAMAKVNLTQSQVAVMEIVAGIPSVSQADVASRLSMDRATMLVIVDRLSNRGLISRTRSIEDRRRQELHLTSSGTRLLAQARLVVAEHEERFTQRFSPMEFASLMSGLRRLHAASSQVTSSATASGSGTVKRGGSKGDKPGVRRLGKPRSRR